MKFGPLSIAQAGILLATVAAANMALANGRGGGFGGGGGRGGGMSRPSGMGGGGGMARPSPSMGHMGGGGAARPAPRPSPNFSRPAQQPSFPAASRPSGGMKPSAGVPNAGAQRPAARPATPTIPGGFIQQGGATRPGGSVQPGNVIQPGGYIRPGGGNIATRPGGSSPNLGGTLPATRPSLPQQPGGIPATRPNLGGPNRPVAGGPAVGGNRPTTRPSPGDVGDFLGIQTPLQPGTLPSRPGPGNIATRPGTGAERPNLGDRPNLGNRPNIGDRPNVGDRPVTRPEIPTTLPGTLPNRPWQPGQRPNIGNNNIIHNRPGWSQIGDNTLVNINNNWNNAIVNRPGRPGVGNWINNHPDRWNHWNGWANNVHNHWDHHLDHCFNNNWWQNHYHDCGGWHYWHQFPSYGWNYWWTVPAWGALTNWFSWGAAPASWSQPVYYDYGTGGNVTYQDNSVYINGQQVATADEFAQSAAALATVPPPASDAEAAKAEWLPLGTFAISTDEKDLKPSRVVQLAVNKEGIVSGTLYNYDTDKASAVQGKVDKQTQRVALRFGQSEDVVAETGLYNLTQEQAPLLVHFGKEKMETYLLVRLTQPEEAATATP